MMKLIIDSGSSNTEWVTVSDHVIEKRITKGINPTSMPSSIDIIKDQKDWLNSDIEEIFYYGSGVSNNSATELIQNAFRSMVSTAQIHVHSDIIAACHATSHMQKSIVTILGSGTNTVLYDGHQIVDSIKSLGYILDDEGSGFSIGKRIIKRFLRSALNKEDDQLFKDTYIHENSDLITQIYKHRRPNYFIASFTRFLDSCSKELKQEILIESFEEYIANHILKIDNYRDYKINFVGSIAYLYQNELTNCIHDAEGQIGQIIQSPMKRLIKYHING